MVYGQNQCAVRRKSIQRRWRLHLTVIWLLTHLLMRLLATGISMVVIFMPIMLVLMTTIVAYFNDLRRCPLNQFFSDELD